MTMPPFVTEREKKRGTERERERGADRISVPLLNAAGGTVVMPAFRKNAYRVAPVKQPHIDWQLIMLIPG